MIAQNIQKQIQEAMKARDSVRLSTLQLLKSALNYEVIALQHELSDEEEISVVKREAKRRRDAIEAYKKTDRKDLLQKEEAELAILQEFLPAEMPDEELEKIVNETIKEFSNPTIKDMGQIMSRIQKHVAGRADGGKIASLVKAKL